MAALSSQAVVSSVCKVAGESLRGARHVSSASSRHSQLSLPLQSRSHRIQRRASALTCRAASAVETSVSDDLFVDYKATVAALFPGQGAQSVGMGAEAASVPAAAALFAKASEILGYDLLEVCLNGPKEKLDSTAVSQPAIYVASLAAVEALRAQEGGAEKLAAIDVAAGLSLGEYTALAFAEAFSFEDGLRLVQLRGEAMQGNYAVSGGVKGCEAVEAKAKEFKARMTVRLAVAGAFHTRFMAPAVGRLQEALAATAMRPPRLPVVSNVDARPHSDPAAIRSLLAQQVVSPVQWETTLKTLLDRGLTESYELGPGKVIAGIMKRIDKKAPAVTNVSV